MPNLTYQTRPKEPTPLTLNSWYCRGTTNVCEWILTEWNSSMFILWSSVVSEFGYCRTRAIEESSRPERRDSVTYKCKSNVELCLAPVSVRYSTFYMWIYWPGLLQVATQLTRPWMRTSARALSSLCCLLASRALARWWWPRRPRRATRQPQSRSRPRNCQDWRRAQQSTCHINVRSHQKISIAATYERGSSGG